MIAEPLQENGPIEGGLRPLHVVPQPDEHLLDVFQQRQRFVEAPLRREDGGHRTPFLRPRSRAQLPVGQPERQLAQARCFGAFPERLDHVRFDDGLLDERSSERLDVPRLERARSVSRQAKPPIAFQLQLEQGGRRFAELPVRDAPGGQIGFAREQQFLECALRAYLLLDNRAHQRDGIVCIPRRHRGCVPPNAPMRPVAMCVKTRRDASIDRSSGTWLLQLESWPIDTFDRAEQSIATSVPGGTQMHPIRDCGRRRAPAVRHPLRSKAVRRSRVRKIDCAAGHRAGDRVSLGSSRAVHCSSAPCAGRGRARWRARRARAARRRRGGESWRERPSRRARAPNRSA